MLFILFIVLLKKKIIYFFYQWLSWEAKQDYLTTSFIQWPFAIKIHLFWTLKPHFKNITEYLEIFIHLFI